MPNKVFPNHIFTGTHPERPSLSTVRPPDHLDYLILVQELKATQDFLLALSKNNKLMPDLESHVLQISEKLTSLSKKLQVIQPPEDLAKNFKDFADALELIEAQKDDTKLEVKSELMTMQTTLETNQLCMLKLQEAFVNNIKGFQNKLLTKFKAFEKEISDRLDAVEYKIEQANVQAKIGNLLSQLDKK